VSAVMQRLCRLSYHDRITAAVPEAFHAMLPPRAAVEELPAPGAADAANGAATAEDLQASTAAEIVQMVSTPQCSAHNSAGLGHASTSRCYSCASRHALGLSSAGGPMTLSTLVTHMHFVDFDKFDWFMRAGEAEDAG
jgi:hypothetical protein